VTGFRQEIEGVAPATNRATVRWVDSHAANPSGPLVVSSIDDFTIMAALRS
jgi:hypothetical protein